ncbi:MAG: chemotaxis response regulator protein-glutamate methylesterase [Acidobacteria bacterium]|nr:chemotaxis response regulator protein-glutamate methylesterase [Acidobacteriota bacterium]
MNSSPDKSAPIRVLITDDSAFMRTALTRMIESDPALCVAGTAMNGNEALQKIPVLRPDVVTLDVEMPGLNGLETLRRIMQEFPLPVIMVSSLTQEGAEETLEALAIGAFDYLPKQSSFVSLDIVKIRDELVAKIKAAAEHHRRKPMGRVTAAVSEKKPSRARPVVCPSIIALGTSTGGPRALQEILPMFPADLPVGILIVQHMPKGFTGPFARRLNNLCHVTIREAEQNDPIHPGTVYIAPAGQHMTVERRSSSKALIHLSNLPEKMLHVPSVDVMMLSAAAAFQSLCMGVIMTGMGADGAQGMQAIYKAGGFTVGQDEATCTVYGMPRACAEAGSLHRVVPLTEIPEQILQAVNYRKHA